MKKLQFARFGYIAISILFYAAAAAYLVFETIPALALCRFSGVVLLIYGSIKIVGFFSEDLYCLAFRYDFAYGLLLIVIGAVILAKGADASAYLSVGLGWIALLDSVLKAQMAVEAKTYGLNQWYLILAAAIATGLLSILLGIACFPEHSRRLVSLTLFDEGISNFCIVRFAVKSPSEIVWKKSDS